MYVVMRLLYLWSYEYSESPDSENALPAVGKIKLSLTGFLLFGVSLPSDIVASLSELGCLYTSLCRFIVLTTMYLPVLLEAKSVDTCLEFLKMLSSMVSK